MAKPKVYFIPTLDAASVKKVLCSALASMKRQFSEKDIIAVKLHFGEQGNTRFVSPKLVKPVISELKKLGSQHFLTDTNTLYRGMRLNAKDHKDIAEQHGFAELGSEIIIADGEAGDDYAEVEVEQKIFKKVKIGKGVALATGIVLVSHFKGHMLFSFGGAIKNLGMGCGSRAGKLEMHSKISPSVNRNACTGCGACIASCGVNAIKLEDGKARISDLCVGCAKCIAVCPADAISIPWGGATREDVRKRCAEYAYGAVKSKKLICITFINNIAKQCDCWNSDSEIISADVGIVASTDPVACDAAAYDLVLKANKGIDVFKKEHGFAGTDILDYADEIGLGSKEYELIKL